MERSQKNFLKNSCGSLGCFYKESELFSCNGKRIIFPKYNCDITWEKCNWNSIFKRNTNVYFRTEVLIICVFTTFYWIYLNKIILEKKRESALSLEDSESVIFFFHLISTHLIRGNQIKWRAHYRVTIIMYIPLCGTDDNCLLCSLLLTALRKADKGVFDIVLESKSIYTLHTV